MDEKMLELMTNMYAEMKQGFANVEQRFGKVEQRLDNVEQRFGKVEQRLDNVEQQFSKVDQRFDNVEQELANVRQEIRQEGARLENQLGGKIDALFDGYKQNAENISTIKSKVEKIEKTIAEKSIIIRESDYILLKKAE